MKFLLPIAAAAAAIAVVAVVLSGRFLPDDSNVGVPTSSPSPTSTLVGGQFTFAGGEPVSIDATSDGSSLSGSLTGAWAGKPYGIRLECLRQYDPQTWMFAGALTESAETNRTAGDWGALIVRDGSPQKAGVYTQPRATADTCEEFASEIPDFAVDGQDMIGDMDEGGIVLPPASGNAIGGEISYHMNAADVVTIAMDGTALDAPRDGLLRPAELSGTATVTQPGGAFTFGLQCALEFDPSTWIIAGDVEESTSDAQPVGTPAAVIVRDVDVSPQEVSLWFEATPSSCTDFIDGINADVIASATFSPVEEGELRLP